MDKKAARLLKVTTKFEIKDNIEDGKEEAVNMCKALVDLMEDAREEGRAEARDEMQNAMAEKQLEIARRLIIRGGFTSEEIADLSGVDEKTVKALM
jgi:DNA-binding NarL/FixJ family response regulator